MAPSTTYKSPSFSRPNSTGKELDEETGFGYFGARYYDATLLAGWTAVDPMADKYPNISPYAYCAWNPMKLVDPDGKEIYVGGLSDEMQKRLCSCLGIITGLELSVNESGLLVSSGTRNDKKKFSKTAQSDLLEAINDKTKRVSVTTNDHSGAETENIFSSKYTGKFWVWDGFDEKTDASYYGLGMTFLHELAHAYFGDIDVTKDNVYSIDEQVPDRPQPDFYVGKAAQRVNIYRRELKMPTRASYAPYQYKQGDPACWKQFDGRVAFKNGNKGIIYQKLR